MRFEKSMTYEGGLHLKGGVKTRGKDEKTMGVIFSTCGIFSGPTCTAARYVCSVVNLLNLLNIF